MKTVLEHLDEKNPLVHINVEELCARGQNKHESTQLLSHDHQ